MSIGEDMAIRRKLSILGEADQSGNVSEICRKHHIGRTQYYEWRRRLRMLGQESLRNMSRRKKHYPLKITKALEDKIIRLSLEHPRYGCHYLELICEQNDISASHTLLQKILNKHGRGTRFQRINSLEDDIAKGTVIPTENQIREIGRSNPCFKERYRAGERPGECMVHGIFIPGVISERIPICVNAVIDTFGSYAIADIGEPALIDANALSLLGTKVIPQYKEWRLEIASIFATYLFWPDDYPELLKQNHIELEYYFSLDIDDDDAFALFHHLSRIRELPWRTHPVYEHGFLESFRRAAWKEFFRDALRKKLFERMEDLGEAFQHWLEKYNNERPHMGYPNYGKTPRAFIEKYLMSQFLKNG